MLGKFVNNNWLFYLLGVVVFLIAIWIICQYAKKTPPPVNSFYFKVIDDMGNESIIHDSGIKPSETPLDQIITLQILKTEYNDGKSQNLTTPKSIKFGLNAKNLSHTISNFKIKDKGFYYVVEFVPPVNPFYGDKNITPILREEVTKTEL